MTTIDLPARASAAGKRSGEVRRRNALERSQRAQAVDRIIDGLEVEQIAPLAYTAAMRMMEHAATAELPEVKSTLDLERIANASRTLFTVARLAAGESTANTLTLQAGAVDLEALAQRVANLRGTDSP